MVSRLDGENTIKNLLVTNWNDANTNSRTPSIEIITLSKVAEVDNFTERKGFILIYNVNTQQEISGMSLQHNHIYENINIDVRIYGDRAQYNLIINEIERILATFATNISPFQFIETFGAIQNFSQEKKQFFRSVKSIRLVKYNQSLT